MRVCPLCRGRAWGWGPHRGLRLCFLTLLMRVCVIVKLHGAGPILRLHQQHAGCVSNALIVKARAMVLMTLRLEVRRLWMSLDSPMRVPAGPGGQLMEASVQDASACCCSSQQKACSTLIRRSWDQMLERNNSVTPGHAHMHRPSRMHTELSTHTLSAHT